MSVMPESHTAWRLPLPRRGMSRGDVRAPCRCPRPGAGWPRRPRRASTLRRSKLRARFGGGREDLHPLLQVHRAVHRLGQRVEILGELAAVLDVLEEAGLGDGGGGLADEDLEQLAVVGAEPEGLVAAEHQHAQQQVLEDDRHAEEAPQAALPPPLRIGGARIGRNVRHLELAPLRGHPSHVTRADIQRAPGEVAQAASHRADLEALRRRVHDPHRHRGHLHELHRRIRDAGQDLVRLERGRHELVEPRQRVQARGPQVERRVQPRVAQQHARLLADGLQRGQLRVLEAPARGPPDEVEGARHLPVDGEGNHEAGLMREAAEQWNREARIVREIVAPDHVPAPKDRVEAPLFVGGEAGGGEHLERGLGDVVGRHRPELRTLRLPDVGRDGLGAREPGQLAADEPEGLAEIGGGARHARHREQCRRLPQPRLEPAGALRTHARVQYTRTRPEVWYPPRRNS